MEREGRRKMEGWKKRQDMERKEEVGRGGGRTMQDSKGSEKELSGLNREGEDEGLVGGG